MTTKDELEAKIEELRTQIKALPDDEPWEPRGGPWPVPMHDDVVIARSGLPWTRLGLTRETEEEALALRDRVFSRNIIDAWITENGGEGDWVVRFFINAAVAVRLPAHGPAIGELTTDEESAKRCAKLINRGLLNLAWPGMTEI